MAGEDTLPPALRALVRFGMMTEEQARDVDAFADGLAARVKAGELTIEEAGQLAEKQAVEDANRYHPGGRRP